MVLEIKNLKARVGQTPVLEGLNLTIEKNTVHAVMGPNGAGKSSLARILAGHPDYEVLEGEVLFNGEDLLALSPSERALKGLFMSFQQPPEIPGVSMAHFLRSALNAQRKAAGETPFSQQDFETLLAEKMALVGMREEFKERSLHEGFSGGEKKRSEILQMALLQPALAILDEMDSGLDVDALKQLAQSVTKRRSAGQSLLVITHYQRLLDYIVPDFVHILYQGKIVRSGGPELALALEEQGYEKVIA